MRGLKGGALLLVLGIPFGLYVAWQANGVARTDMVVSDAPAGRGAPKDQLAAARAKTAAWSAETRKAVAVAWQYRPAGPDDATPGNPDAAGVVQAAAARSADLNDLDRFLAEIEAPNYKGNLKATYDGWTNEAKETRKKKQAVEDWFRNPPGVTSVADAGKKMDAIDELIKKYSAGKSTDRAKAAHWRVRARLLIIDSLAAQADALYLPALKVKLPLESGNTTVNRAVETLGGLEGQIAALHADVKQAEEDGIKLDAPVRTAVDAKTSVGLQCAASRELLTLFAKDDLFRKPDGADVWLKKVAAQYKHTQNETVKAILRDKVQEFCEAFIPATVRLDDKLLIEGEEALRASVTVTYVEDGKAKSAPLSDEMTGLNEFNLVKRYPDPSTFYVYKMKQERPKVVKPTSLSEAAVLFNTERAKVGVGINGPKWTLKSVDELKKKCDDQTELVNRLKAPGTGIAGDELKISKRLESLAAGLKSAGDLIEPAP